MKTKWRKYLLLPLIFILSVVLTFIFQAQYKYLVLRCYLAFTDGVIMLAGKTWFLFPGGSMMLSFGVFCTSISLILFKRKNGSALKIFTAIFAFFLATFIVCFIKSNNEVSGCTSFRNHRAIVFINDVPFDTIFVASLVVSFLVFWLADILISRRKQEFF